MACYSVEEAVVAVAMTNPCRDIGQKELAVTLRVFVSSLPKSGPPVKVTVEAGSSGILQSTDVAIDPCLTAGLQEDKREAAITLRVVIQNWQGGLLW